MQRWPVLIWRQIYTTWYIVSSQELICQHRRNSFLYVVYLTIGMTVDYSLALVALCEQWPIGGSFHKVSVVRTRKRSPVMNCIIHYDDVIMGAVASQITSLTIVYSTVYSDTDQKKHQRSASLAFVWGIHRGPMDSPHKWAVTRNIFSFHDVIMFGSRWGLLFHGTKLMSTETCITDRFI